MFFPFCFFVFCALNVVKVKRWKNLTACDGACECQNFPLPESFFGVQTQKQRDKHPPAATVRLQFVNVSHLSRSLAQVDDCISSSPLLCHLICRFSLFLSPVCLSPCLYFSPVFLFPCPTSLLPFHWFLSMCFASPRAWWRCCLCSFEKCG